MNKIKKKCKEEVTVMVVTTKNSHNMIFSVTYYLESRNVIIVYHEIFLFANHGRIGRLDTIEH